MSFVTSLASALSCCESAIVRSRAGFGVRVSKTTTRASTWGATCEAKSWSFTGCDGNFFTATVRIAVSRLRISLPWSERW